MVLDLTDDPEIAATLMRGLPVDVRDESINGSENVIDGRRRFGRRRQAVRINPEYDGSDD